MSAQRRGRARFDNCVGPSARRSPGLGPGGTVIGRCRLELWMPDTVVDWLLEPSQPSVRYLTLTRLLGRRESDSQLRRARSAIAMTGWVPELLRRRHPEGWWGHTRHWLEPRFTGTHWNMLALADLGASRDIPEVETSAEYWMGNSPLQGGGVGGFGKGKGHHCYTANMARALIRMGYEDDPRVRKTMEWLVETAHPKGGWSCRYAKNGPAESRTLDAWEGLAAFAEYPRSKWTADMHECVDRAAEFYLERELHRQGERYEPWYRFHWPNHYYYDLLVGADCLTALGHAGDPRLRFALDLVRSKRRADGRWNHDADQTDPDPESAKWFAANPGKRPVPLTIEAPGKPSKMVTLRSLLVLSRVP